jgi:uncharacterized membrane protein
MLSSARIVLRVGIAISSKSYSSNSNVMKKVLSLFLFFIGLSTLVYAQERVNGIIKDDSGQSLPGATVVQKGSSNHVNSKFPQAKNFHSPFKLT